MFFGHFDQTLFGHFYQKQKCSVFALFSIVFDMSVCPLFRLSAKTLRLAITFEW